MTSSLSSYQEQTQREAVVCGPNSALIFLTICGRDVSDDDLLLLNCGEDGVSIEQLKEFCCSNGQNAEVRKVDAEDFCKLPMPVIMHARGNHFQVAYEGTRDGGLLVIDGTTGRKSKADANLVGGFYSGYVIVRSEGFFWRHLEANGPFFLFVMIAVSAFYMLWTRKFESWIWRNN